jgi:hypothetical protein
MLDCAKGRRLDVENMDITLLSNSSALQFCANLSGMMTNCANCTTVSLPQLESGAKPCQTVPKKEDLM